MALDLPKVKNIFETGKERNEGIPSRGQYVGRQILSGSSKGVLAIGSTLEIPIIGRNDTTGSGIGIELPTICDISNISVKLGTNTFDTAYTTMIFTGLDKDGNLLFADVFTLYTPGETGRKEFKDKTYTLPAQSTITLSAISTNFGAGTATNFKFIATLDILK